MRYLAVGTARYAHDAGAVAYASLSSQQIYSWAKGEDLPQALQAAALWVDDLENESDTSISGVDLMEISNRVLLKLGLDTTSSVEEIDAELKARRLVYMVLR